MKKILSFILLMMLLLLVGCTTGETQLSISVDFSVKDTFEHTIGDDKHDYLLDVVAQTSESEDLTEFVVIDDLGVNYMLVGEYTIYFSLMYNDQLYQDSAKITVKQKTQDAEITVIFEVVESYEYTIGEDTPAYIEGVVAKYSDQRSLLEHVTYDDSLVNYEVIGTYPIYFSLNIDVELLPIESQVLVKEVVVPFNVNFNIYYMNDFHGAILSGDNQMGLARIGNLIMDEKTKNDETTLFITGGDILQGQLISNWYDGASTIELLNDMDLDAFVVGNHELDWGMDVLTQYFDGSSNLQASFPLLGANVYDKSTNDLTAGFEPYTIIEKSGVKIAIIGTMGYGLESSIAYARVKDYEFIDPVERTRYFAEQARVVDGADIVIAVNHGDHDYYNNEVANFTGNQRVDAIFNGHTHRSYTRSINNKPVIQSGGNGSHVGHVTIHYSSNSGVYGVSARNLNSDNEPRLDVAHTGLQTKIEGFYNEIASLYEPIMVSEYAVQRSTLTTYIGQLMQTKYNADVGLHNGGGTRADIAYLEGLSYAKLHAISPFDNSVVLVDVTGQELLDAIGSEDAYFRPGLSRSNINLSSMYKLALNDYIFGSKAFLRNKPAEFTGFTVLDLFVESVTNQSEVYEMWDTSLPLMFNQEVSIFSHLFTYSTQIYI